MGLFALIGGFLIDSMGRKRVAVSGFILLGLRYSDLRNFYIEYANFVC